MTHNHSLQLAKTSVSIKKSALIRNVKSIGNMPRYKQSDNFQELSPGLKKLDYKSKSWKETKHRSKSVDGRLRSLFCTTSVIIDAKSNKKSHLSSPTQTQDDFGLSKKFKNTTNRANWRFSDPRKPNPLMRNSYENLAWSEKQQHPLNNKGKHEDKRQTFSHQLDFKELEKKNQKEKQRLSEIMQKLELDLELAKKDLLEDDIEKTLDLYKLRNRKSKVSIIYFILVT